LNKNHIKCADITSGVSRNLQKNTEKLLIANSITYQQSMAHYSQGIFPLCSRWHEIVDILQLHTLPLLVSQAHPKKITMQITTVIF